MSETARRIPDTTGLVLAGWLFAESLEPTLLLRTWAFQGLLAGVAITLGYGVGRVISAAFQRLWRRSRWQGRPTGVTLDVAHEMALLGTVTLVLAAVVRAVPQHRWTWERLGHESASFVMTYVGTLALALGVSVALLGVGLLGQWAWRRITTVGTRVLPAWIAGTLATVVLVWGVLAALNAVVLARTLDAANATFEAGDVTLVGAPEPPGSSLRSGGPGSMTDWRLTGREGRRFLTRGPTPAELEDLVGSPVEEPVRVFVGRAQADDVGERVALAVRELERTGAFRRAALLVVIPTGTGWINEQVVQPVEYFHRGDVATVAVQYSHLPSPLAFLAEQDAAATTAEHLVRAVEERLSGSRDRPLLYVAGESLGSYGGGSAFASLEDSARRTDGAVWVGPPETMHLRREAERRRQPGSLQVRPLVGDGTQFFFVNRGSDFDDLAADERPHSVFLQQTDDPIVWWDWQTFHEEPDWLREPLDAAVNPALDWTPGTTFLQLAVDMVVSNDFDEEHGHLYGTLPLTAWHRIVQPEGWDESQLEELRRRLADVAR